MTRRLSSHLAGGAAAAAAISVPVVALALLVETKWRPLRDLDRGVADDLNRWALTRPGSVDVLHTLQEVLSPWSFRGAALAVTAAVAVRAGRTAGRRVAAWSVTALATGGILGAVLKQVVHRARPTFEDPVAHAGSYSFPSGHALNSFLGAGVVLVLVLPLLPRAGRVLAWLAAAAIVLLTGFDRVALGVHYVSDVVAGWLVALAVLVSTTLAFQAWRRDTGRGTSDVLSEGLEPAAQQRGAA